jgi:hypothetical protein
MRHAPHIEAGMLRLIVNYYNYLCIIINAKITVVDGLGIAMRLYRTYLSA